MLLAKKRDKCLRDSDNGIDVDRRGGMEVVGHRKTVWRPEGWGQGSREGASCLNGRAPPPAQCLGCGSLLGHPRGLGREGSRLASFPGLLQAN